MAILTACSSQNKNVTLDISSFKNDDEFSYNGLVWGSSPDDNASVIDKSTETIIDQEGVVSGVMYAPNNIFMLDDFTAESNYFFTNDRLAGITFSFTLEENSSEYIAEKLAEFTEIYGEPSEFSENEFNGLQNSFSRWILNDTSLNITAIINTAGNDILTINILHTDIMGV